MNIKKNSLFFVILCFVVSNMTFAAEGNPSKKRTIEGPAFREIRMDKVKRFADEAVENGALDTITALINLGYPLSGQDIDHHNWLHDAAEYADEDSLPLETFIEAGADLDLLSSGAYPQRPLQAAIGAPSHKGIAMLLAAGANPNIEKYNSSLLMDTFRDVNKELFDVLIAAPAIDVNYTTLHGKTALSALVASYRSEENRTEYIWLRHIHQNDLRAMAQTLWAKNPSIVGLGFEDRSVLRTILGLQAPAIDVLVAADALESDLSQED